MNVELLKRVALLIKQEPKAFDMDSYATKTTDSPCGMTHCIGGACCMLTFPHQFITGALDSFENIDFELACKAAGLTKDQAERLFYIDERHRDGAEGWPEEFIKRYDRVRSAKAKALVAHDRILHFIKTKGRE